MSQPLELVGQGLHFYMQAGYGTFSMYEGEIYANSEVGRFKNAVSIGHIILCAPIEKVVYRGAVWLWEKNDQLAIQLLIDYHEQRIKEYELYATTCRTKIDILKEAAKNV